MLQPYEIEEPEEKVPWGKLVLAALALWAAAWWLA